jgi:hypothetical protein
MQFAYGLSEVINQIPKLEHGTDGFIYTKVEAPYKAGTDDAMCVLSESLPRPLSLHWSSPLTPVSQIEMETTA